MNALHSGVFSIQYDQGSLRHISYGDTEIVRMIYFALRDHTWETMPSRILDEKIETTNKSFKISYLCVHYQDGEDIIEWNCDIQGNENGKIVFDIQGTVLNNFRKNRAGLCILHPIPHTKGSPAQIIQDNGEIINTMFPDRIDPENPFTNIRSMRWKIKNDWYRLDMEGDIFETEDQRNWSDASFKTFCTPLENPMPVALKTGDKIQQRVTFTPEGDRILIPVSPPYVELTNQGESFKVPAIGISASTEVEDLTAESVSLLKQLNFSHYRVEVYVYSHDWGTLFSKDCQQAFKLDLPLEVALHLGNNFEMETHAFIQLCLMNRLRINKILLLSKDKKVTDERIVKLIPYLKTLLANVLFGAGTDINFTEINRNRFIARDFDFVSYSLHPQVHAFDDLTLIENLEAQYYTVISAKGIYGASLPVHISPVTLRSRFNKHSGNPDEREKDNTTKADPRQITSFGAVWTFGSICSLAKSGVEAITYYQTVGNQGLVSTSCRPHPVYYALKEFTGVRGQQMGLLKSDKPLLVQAVLFNDGLKIGIVNFTAEEQDVRFGSNTFKLQPNEIRIRNLNSAQHF